jgi:bifunctional non-homologous end joining protein LigD
MTARLPELAGLPAGLVLDGEIVAWDAGGFPSFPALWDRLLHRRRRAAVTYFVFDVLAIDGKPTPGFRTGTGGTGSSSST